MSTILCQIIIMLNLMLGNGNHTQQAQSIYNSHSYTTTSKGVVIIDTDEL
ncbi:MAG TPA: hypothetical protein VE978_25390 [Chitinophagales bacterium]|nr:hypothetical protein [Chitinophagales bacterium]